MKYNRFNTSHANKSYHTTLISYFEVEVQKQDLVARISPAPLLCLVISKLDIAIMDCASLINADTNFYCPFFLTFL